MKKISRLLNYLADYKGKIGLYFLFNLLSILFGLFSFTLIIPVLNVLFNTMPASTAEKVASANVLHTGIIDQANGRLLFEHTSTQCCLTGWLFRPLRVSVILMVFVCVQSSTESLDLVCPNLGGGYFKLPCI